MRRLERPCHGVGAGTGLCPPRSVWSACRTLGRRAWRDASLISTGSDATGTDATGPMQAGPMQQEPGPQPAAEAMAAGDPCCCMGNQGIPTGSSLAISFTCGRGMRTWPTASCSTPAASPILLPRVRAPIQLAAAGRCQHRLPPGISRRLCQVVGRVQRRGGDLYALRGREPKQLLRRAHT